MIKRKWSYGIIRYSYLFAFLVAGVGCSPSHSRDEEASSGNELVLSLEDVLTEIQQPGSKLTRVFETEIERESEFRLTDSTGIALIELIKQVDDNHFIVSDPTQANVFRLNAEYNVVTEYSSGAGAGPGQLLNPTSIAIDINNNVYIGDSMNLKIEIYTQDGRHIKSLPLDRPPFRISIVGDVMVVTLFDRENLFRIYSIDNVLTDSEPSFTSLVKPFAPDARMFTLLAAGDLAVSNNVIVHALTFIPALVLIDMTASTIKIMPTIDNQSAKMSIDTFFPPIEGPTRAPTKHYSGPVFVESDTIYVQSRAISDRSLTIIDRYTMDGDYLSSIKINSSGNSIGVWKSELIVASESGQVLERFRF